MHRRVKPIIQIITSTINVIAHDQLVLAISDDDSKPRRGEHRFKEVTHEDYCDA